MPRLVAGGGAYTGPWWGPGRGDSGVIPWSVAGDAACTARWWGALRGQILSMLERYYGYGRRWWAVVICWGGAGEGVRWARGGTADATSNTSHAGMFKTT